MDNDNSKPHWANVSEAGSILGIRILLTVYRLFGRSLFLLTLYPVIIYFFLFRPASRHASIQYLSRLKKQGLLTLRGPLLWLSFRHFLSFANSILDKFIAWIGQINYADIDYENLSLMMDRMDQKQGALLIASHLGNVEVSRALTERRPQLKMTILAHTKNAEQFNRLLNEFSDSQNITIMQVSELTPASSIQLAEKIQAGEFVVVTGDRTPIESDDVTSSRRVCSVDFIGAKANFPQGPFLIGSILKCPVYMIFCIKFKKRYKIIFEPFASAITLPRRNREEKLQSYAQQYAARLEHYCAIAPLQWNNFFPFWDKPGHPDTPKTL